DLVVTADHRNLIHTLKFGDSFLRHQQRVQTGVADEAHPAVLTRSENIFRIRKKSSQTDSSGLRIKLPVGGKEFTFSRVRSTICQNKIQYQSLFSFSLQCGSRIALNESKVLLLTDNKISFDWIKLRDCSEDRLWANQVSYLPGRNSSHAINQ